MTSIVDVAGRAAATSSRQPVRRLVLISAAFLVLQVLATDYGEGSFDPAGAAIWLVVGLILLGLVHRRRSRVARGVIVISSFCGAGIYAFGLFSDWRATLIAVCFLGQGLPLVTEPVRRHVQQ